MTAEQYMKRIETHVGIILYTDELLEVEYLDLIKLQGIEEAKTIVLTLETQRDTYNSYGRFLATTLDPVSGRLNTKGATVCFLCANELNDTIRKVKKIARKGGQEV